MKFKTTEDIKVPERVIDQVIGQEEAVEIIKKAAKQRRHVLLIGEPGTGKSMLGQAMAELMPKEKLVDILSLYNPRDENNPLIRTVPAGQGRKIVISSKVKPTESNLWKYAIIGFFVFYAASVILEWIIGQETSEILKAADRISGTMFLISIIVIMMITMASLRMQSRSRTIVPKVIVDNSDKDHAPFVDATGAHEGALLGDVMHDPFQTGGLGTPAHERVVAGAIHKAHKGVLFIDEIATLKPEMQIELLTAMQEKKMPITGRSEKSAGAMVKTEPVPCDFVLVAAGNLESIKHIHPALRSRIQGSGYEVYMKDKMKDTKENRDKIARFVAQEVVRDGKIPHFTKKAVEEIIRVSRRMSGRRGYLSIKFRSLGGIVRIAGDIAREEGAKHVAEKHVKKALKYAGSLEKQVAERYIDEKKEYQVIQTSGKEIGKVNGLAVIGDSGLILPIEAVAVPAMKKGSGEIIATGKLGQIAKEAVINVAAIIKKVFGKDISNYDIHIQFLQTYEGVEGDSASVSIATAVISALEKLKIKQDIAMTGSLSVRGEVLPVGGINEKIEAAKNAGLKAVIIPKTNQKDVLVDGIKVIPAEKISDVLKASLANKKDWEKIRGKF
ncbi:ATP-dependent protease LonB [Nanoarchaeota archaeon]|nr:MAG: ATP-dependent protease LonB [Nanoarchaeota archaeon]